jgi:hypothetical protein
VKGQAVYQLPFGKGKKYLNNNAIVDETVGGWQLSGTLQLQSGTPITPIMLVDNSNASFDSNNGSSYAHQQFPNVVGNVKASGTSGSTNEWFNVGAFSDPGAYTYGDAHRNMVFGPKLTAINASLHKVFPIWGNVKLDFFANCTNFPNHPSFGDPDGNIDNGNPANPTDHGQINSTTVGGRNIEMVAKLKF